MVLQKIYKSSKYVYLTSNSSILQIDRQALSSIEVECHNEDVEKFLKIKDREKNITFIDQPRAVFGVLQLPDRSTYFVVEPSQNYKKNYIQNLFLSTDEEYYRNDFELGRGEKIYLLKRPIELIQISFDSATLKTDTDKKHKELFSCFPLGPGNEFFYAHISNYNLTQTYQHQTCQRVDIKWLWNRNLLLNNSIFQDNLRLAFKYCVMLCHGFTGTIWSKNIGLTLMAKRSSYFAGTRFLKRGSDLKGNCANEVEIEQIVMDSSRGKVTSFVQSRGSVPGLWSQDIAYQTGNTQQAPKVPVKRPDISISLVDACFKIEGRHFAYLVNRFEKVQVLNLLRDATEEHDEVKIANHLNETIQYLNFIHPSVDITNFDMKNEAKSTILNKLEELAETYITDSNFNQSWNSNRQTSITRSNCLDCLDRTNTAQLIIGQVALSHQLVSLGNISSTKQVTLTNIGMQYPQLFELLGNAIAQQYAGSTLVHNLDSYDQTQNKKSRDMFTSMNRYYSNTFSDADKQLVISAFLRVLRLPDKSTELEIYDHFPYDECLDDLYRPQKDNILWFEYRSETVKELAVEKEILGDEFYIPVEKSTVKLNVLEERETDFKPCEIQYKDNNLEFFEKLKIAEEFVKPKPEIDENYCWKLPPLLGSDDINEYLF